MARLQLNKSSLARESASLGAYQRYLPSLDLKRRQLMTERARTARALADTRSAVVQVEQDIGARVPMLANENTALAGLVVIDEVRFGEENLVGVRLPTLQTVSVNVRPYSYLAKPHWVDLVVARLRESLLLHLQEDLLTRRLALLDAAVAKVAQRVNLFEKVLIPRTRENIRRIRIHLSDEQVSAVVRSKLAKRKHAGPAHPPAGGGPA